MSICLWIIKKSSVINFLIHVGAHCQDRNKELNVELLWPRLPGAGVFSFQLQPVLMLGKLSGGACARGSGGYPGRRAAGFCLALVPMLVLHPAAPVVVWLWVASRWAASAAIMPHVDSSRVVLGVQWARKKFPFCNLREKEWVGIRSLVSISCVCVSLL